MHEWVVHRFIDPSKAWMYCLPRGMGSSELAQPPPLSPNRRSSSSTSCILWHLFDPTLVLEECFWGGYFIIHWNTLIVTLTYWEKVFVIVYVILLLGLCYRICSFYVSQIFSLRFSEIFIMVFDVARVSYMNFSNDFGWRNVQNKICRSRKVIQLCSWQLFHLKSSCQGKLCLNFSNLKFEFFKRPQMEKQPKQEL